MGWGDDGRFTGIHLAAVHGGVRDTDKGTLVASNGALEFVGKRQSIPMARIVSMTLVGAQVRVQFSRDEEGAIETVLLAHGGPASMTEARARRLVDRLSPHITLADASAEELAAAQTAERTAWEERKQEDSHVCARCRERDGRPYFFYTGTKVKEDVRHEGSSKVTTSTYRLHGDESVPICDPCLKSTRRRETLLWFATLVALGVPAALIFVLTTASEEDPNSLWALGAFAAIGAVIALIAFLFVALRSNQHWGEALAIRARRGAFGWWDMGVWRGRQTDR